GCTISGDTTGNITGSDPNLAALADNGGLTWTRALLAASPAYNAIPAASCTLVVDQRGMARPQGAGCDIGAFEARPPVANDDSAATAGVAVPIDVPANDADDTALDRTTVTVTGGPGNGSVSIDPTTGVVTYTPNAGFTGSDSFTYTILDEHGFASNVATVTITVTQAPNAAPVAQNDTASTVRNVAVTVDVLANDSDTDGALVPSSVTIVSTPANGSAVANADGTITYTPGAGFVGVDTLTYTVQDDDGETSNTATVTITVTQAPNIAPVANNDTATTNQGAAVTINVLANDGDADGTLVPGSVTVVSAPAHGTAVVNADGTITYTPNAAFSGTDTFTYTVQDNVQVVSNVATVTVTVNQVAAPVEIPEPATLLLFSLGLAALAGYAARKRN
ncbi:MAG: tandem-95 repeat protein, partial [Anaerolineae bacterium]|nr:tandem-95 repeat protein [Anaerolineae bacterium]